MDYVDALPFLAFAVVTGGGAAWSAVGLSRRGRGFGLGAGIAVGVLGLKAALSRMPGVELAVFPWTWYVYLSAWHFPAAVFVSVFLWKRMVSPWGRVRAVALSAVLMGVVLWSVRFFFLPTGEEQLKGAWDADGVCIQSERWSCVPAACATLLREIGVATSEGEFARVSLARPGYGTSVLGTVRGLRILAGEKGYRVKVVRGDAEMLGKLRKPCLILSKFDVPHVDVVYAIGPGGMIVAEPSWGMESWPNVGDIPEVWSGLAVVVYRESMFEAPTLIYRDGWQSSMISAEVRERFRAASRTGQAGASPPRHQDTEVHEGGGGDGKGERQDEG